MEPEHRLSAGLVAGTSVVAMKTCISAPNPVPSNIQFLLKYAPKILLSAQLHRKKAILVSDASNWLSTGVHSATGRAGN